MNYNKADFIASYGISSQLPESDRPELSFSGRSNVGKSSLINKLCNRKNLARVSSTPGKTATINFYEVDNCYFVDLPGYGYAKVSNADRERWDDLINSYFEAPRHHTLLVQLIDCRHAPSADDLQMLKYLHYHQIPFVVALTKADKLKKSQLAKTQEDFEKVCLPYGCQKVVLTSGENGYGIPELQAVLNEAVAAEFTDDEEAEETMAYNEDAYCYDEFNGEADYDALYEQIRQELNAHDIRDGILADLGCGTGELTLMLTQAGYDMIGIDQSEEMLCVVRDKAEQLGLSGKLLLLQQDLLKLDLYGTIRGAVSTFDTFNHIPDLDTAIANAAFFMEEGGVFLFDMNTPYKHQKVLGENVFTFEEEDAACVWRNHYRPADRRVEITVDIDYRETGEHFHEQFYEYTYDLDTIRAALEKHGFVLEKVCDGESFGPLTEESERYFFCAVKQYTQLEEKENV